MKRSVFAFVFILTINVAWSQAPIMYQEGVNAYQNLKTVTHLYPYSVGGVGFDTRYEGVKGSPRLFDTLLTSLIKIKGQQDYFQLKTDIDPFGNTLIFSHPSTGKLLAVPAGEVDEVIIKNEGKDFIFRTMHGSNFDRDNKDQKFYQVLMEKPFLFIKVPVKLLTKADFKDPYSRDTRYDEFETVYRYYILLSDNIYHRIQLSRKSLIKLFPEKKALINSFEDESFTDDEEMVKFILEKL